MNFDEIAQLEKQVLIPTYDRLPILPVRGEGCYLYDDQGKKYLDFLGGLAVNSLGYAHPEILAALRDEAETLLHVSNLLYHPYQAPLAKKLTALAGLDRAFFANSGTEAIEGALKLVRAYARRHQEPFADEILAIENSFHGRTFGALSATWPEKYRKPFEPLVPGIRFVRLNDATTCGKALRRAWAAVLLEVIQGEGGVVELSEEFLKTAEELCRTHDALLICDEIQCGLGRTGRFFAFTKFGLAARRCGGGQAPGGRPAPGGHSGPRRSGAGFLSRHARHDLWRRAAAMPPGPEGSRDPRAPRISRTRPRSRRLLPRPTRSTPQRIRGDRASPRRGLDAGGRTSRSR